jgi:hypothetical protein
MKHLEPVVKKRPSYSILFLRDDSKVVSFRLKPFWIKFLAITVFIFSIASGTAGYAAHYYWKKYQTLQRERTELTATLGENRRQLGRFAGVERIKESTLPRSSMLGVPSITGTPDTANPTQNGTTDTSGSNAQKPANPAETLQETDTAASDQKATEKKNDIAPPQAVTPPAANEGAANPQETDNADKPKGEHPALVSEVQLRPVGNKTFKMSFDLSNRDQQLTLNGRVTVAVKAASGESQEVTQISKDSLRFIINRYKRVTTEFVLPGELRTENVTAVYLTVVSDGQANITYTFPVPTPP